MKRIAWTLGTAIFVPALYWVNGFDFDHRGYEAVGCTFFTTLCTVAQWIAPWWSETR